MPKTLTQNLKERQAAKKPIFIPYMMAGDHERGVEGLEETIDFLSDLGVSAIEVGIPFSDPVADGPVIEQAGKRSLEKGTTIRAIMAQLKLLKTKTPLIIMTYMNPIFQYGLDTFVADLSETNVKGLIIPDLPYEHRDMIVPLLEETDVALISLISLTTPLERQVKLLEEAEGFVYAVTVNGVTGKTTTYAKNLDHHLSTLTSLAKIPVLTGFGISNLIDVKRFIELSDGVIVGSAIVEGLYRQKKQEIATFITKSLASDYLSSQNSNHSLSSL